MKKNNPNGLIQIKIRYSIYNNNPMKNRKKENEKKEK